MIIKILLFSQEVVDNWRKVLTTWTYWTLRRLYHQAWCQNSITSHFMAEVNAYECYLIMQAQILKMLKYLCTNGLNSNIRCLGRLYLSLNSRMGKNAAKRVHYCDFLVANMASTQKILSWHIRLISFVMILIRKSFQNCMRPILYRARKKKWR